MDRNDQPHEPTIHQTLHGYGHGHDLLAASESLDDEIANILGHNSDSAPNARVSDGPYLTGYGLPDGRYVIARTWNQALAERPNTVLTLSLLLPSAVPPGFSSERLLEALVEPEVRPVDGRLPPISIERTLGPELTLLQDEAEEAARYYRSTEPLHSDLGRSRDRIALAVWNQLWRSCRYDLQFCTAPDTQRFNSRGRTLRFEDLDGREPPRLERRPSVQVIVRDLEQPGEFRAFLHFVGSGERSVGLVEPFAEAYLLLGDPVADVSQFTQLLANLRGGEPRRLRRLKRRFLSFVDGTPLWKVDPFSVLQQLAAGPLGQAVYASDASLDRWVRFCWDLDAEWTAQELVNTLPDLADRPAGPATAAEGLASAFATQASDLITPATLGVAIVLNRPAALGAVWDRNEPELWATWADLATPVGIPAGSVPASSYDWLPAVAALRARPEALSRLLREHPHALDALVSAANDAPAPADSQLDLSTDAKRYLQHCLESSDSQLVGLARLADPGAVPKVVDVPAWRQVLADTNDEAVLATAYLIARQGDPKLWELLTISASSLYRVLGAEDAIDAWTRLSPHLRGDRRSWDRCGRLITDYAAVVRRYHDPTKIKAIALLGKRNARAASALEAALRPPKSKKFRLLDPSTWL